MVPVGRGAKNDYKGIFSIIKSDCSIETITKITILIEMIKNVGNDIN